jgi:hypothetical protein
MEAPSTVTTPKFKSALHTNGKRYVPIAAIIDATPVGALTPQALRKRCRHAEKRDPTSVWRPKTREEMPSLIAQGHFCFGATTGLLVREDMVATVAPEAFGAPARKRKQLERPVEAKTTDVDGASSLSTLPNKSARISPTPTAPAQSMQTDCGGWKEAETLQRFNVDPPAIPDFLLRFESETTQSPSDATAATTAATAPARPPSPTLSNCTTETEASTTLPRFQTFAIAAAKPKPSDNVPTTLTPPASSIVNAVASPPSAGQIRRRGTLETPHGLTEEQHFMVVVADAYCHTFVDSAKQHNFRKCIRQIIANQPVKRSGTQTSRIRNGDLTSSTLFVETAMPSNAVGGTKLTIGCAEFSVWEAMAKRLGVSRVL